MFWMTKKVQEELKERFQEDYPKVKWYLALQPFLPIFYGLAMACVFIIFHILHISVNQYPWWTRMLAFAIPIFILQSPFLIVITRMERKYQITDRLDGSLYRERLHFQAQFARKIILGLFILLILTLGILAVVFS